MSMSNFCVLKTHHNLLFSPQKGRKGKSVFFLRTHHNLMFLPQMQGQSVYMSSKPTTIFCFHHKNKGRVNQCLFSLEAISPQILSISLMSLKPSENFSFQHKSKHYLPSYIVFNTNIKTYVQTASLSSKPTTIYCFLHT